MPSSCTLGLKVQKMPQCSFTQIPRMQTVYREADVKQYCQGNNECFNDFMNGMNIRLNEEPCTYSVTKPASCSTTMCRIGYEAQNLALSHPKYDAACHRCDNNSSGRCS